LGLTQYLPPPPPPKHTPKKTGKGKKIFDQDAVGDGIEPDQEIACKDHPSS